MQKFSSLAVMLFIAFSTAAIFLEYEIKHPITAEGPFCLLILARLAITVVFVAFSLYLYWRISEIVKEVAPMFREHLNGISLFFLFLAVAFGISMIRPLDLLIFGTTAVYINILGRRWAIDAWAIAVSHMALITAFYFYFMYAQLYLEETAESKYSYVALMFLTVAFSIAIHPDNNYSMAIEPVTPIKVLTRVIILIYAILPCYAMSVGIRRRITMEESKVMKMRLYMLLSADVIMVLAALTYLLDALTPESYSPWIVAMYLLMAVGLSLVGIAILGPEWFDRIVMRALREDFLPVRRPEARPASMYI